MKRKILVVDDSEVIRLALMSYLEPVGFQVLHANNGEEGLKIAETNAELSMVIADYNMPRLDGIEMSKRIHALQNYEKLPIVVLSAQSDGDLKRRAREAGIVGWLVKPINIPNLIALINSVLP